jgi:hypothetical protein
LDLGELNYYFAAAAQELSAEEREEIGITLEHITLQANYFLTRVEGSSSINGVFHALRGLSLLQN